jgi:hypothetical protein
LSNITPYLSSSLLSISPKTQDYFLSESINNSSIMAKKETKPREKSFVMATILAFIDEQISFSPSI